MCSPKSSDTMLSRAYFQTWFTHEPSSKNSNISFKIEEKKTKPSRNIKESASKTIKSTCKIDDIASSDNTVPTANYNPYYTQGRPPPYPYTQPYGPPQPSNYPWAGYYQNRPSAHGPSYDTTHPSYNQWSGYYQYRPPAQGPSYANAYPSTNPWSGYYQNHPPAQGPSYAPTYPSASSWTGYQTTRPPSYSQPSSSSQHASNTGRGHHTSRPPAPTSEFPPSVARPKPIRPTYIPWLPNNRTPARPGDGLNAPIVW